MRKNGNSYVSGGARKLLLGVLATGAFLVAYTQWVSPTQAAPAPKVEICHIPPGNPDNAHTIRVSGNAIKAHLKHGDALGPCEVSCPDDCDDGNACTIDDCSAGTCSHQPVSCNDGEQCTMDSCNPETSGCEYVPLPGAPCSEQDDAACTLDTGFCSAAGDCELTGVPDCCESDDQCADDDLCTFEACVDNVCEPDGTVVARPTPRVNKADAIHPRANASTCPLSASPQAHVRPVDSATMSRVASTHQSPDAVWNQRIAMTATRARLMSATTPSDWGIHPATIQAATTL